MAERRNNVSERTIALIGLHDLVFGVIPRFFAGLPTSCGGEEKRRPVSRHDTNCKLLNDKLHARASEKDEERVGRMTFGRSLEDAMTAGIIFPREGKGGGLELNCFWIGCGCAYSASSRLTQSGYLVSARV